nr:hypothetical protein [Hydrococcus sp. Prado102]
NIDLEPGEQVTVTGEVSKKNNEFDAFSITRSNGSTINIRPADGPPPWAGGPNRGRDRIRPEGRQPNRPKPPEPR